MGAKYLMYPTSANTPAGCLVTGNRIDTGELPGDLAITGDGPHRKGKARKVMNG